MIITVDRFHGDMNQHPTENNKRNDDRDTVMKTTSDVDSFAIVINVRYDRQEFFDEVIGSTAKNSSPHDIKVASGWVNNDASSFTHEQ